MISQIDIVDTTETDSGWTFTVELEGHKYSVKLNQDYWQALTSGEVKPVALITAAFDFLLEREPAGSILSEFELSQILHYFPEFENRIDEYLPS